MTNRVRVNLVNPQELLELPGISAAEVEMIIRFRREHGPIENEQQFGTILGGPWTGLGLVVAGVATRSIRFQHRDTQARRCRRPAASGRPTASGAPAAAHRPWRR